MLGITGAALCTQCNKNVKYSILTIIELLDLLEVCFALVLCDSYHPAHRLRRFRWGSPGCELAHHPSPRHSVSFLGEAASFDILRATCHGLRLVIFL